MNVLRKRRARTKQNPNQRDIFGTKTKRIKKCVFCEIGIDLDEDISVADGFGDLLHLTCFDERLEIYNEGKSLQRDKKNKGTNSETT